MTKGDRRIPLVVKDRSGEAKLALWNLNKVLINRGDVIKVVGVRKALFNGNAQMTTTVKTRVSVSIDILKLLLSADFSFLKTSGLQKDLMTITNQQHVNKRAVCPAYV